MNYYKAILKSEHNLTDQETEDVMQDIFDDSRKNTDRFEVVSAINLEGTTEALTLNEEKQTEKLDFGAQNENNPTD